MTQPFRTPEDYELFLYSLTEQFPSVNRSTIVFIRRGATLARVAGELHFKHNIRLVVRERVLYQHLPLVMDWYGYEVWQDEEKLYWYDSQPHPNNPELASTHPHHKHIPPDIKHNRIPAPTMSFTRPNLPALIQEIEELISKIETETDT
ncbi:MAG: hypothetical protein H6633_09090 [Anaerolineales bacterium]|nr:hypothetical protein [Anaerolineales bacterium]MCB9104385.1 hypothetical protein [Anaerolineales bacterium]